MRHGWARSTAKRLVVWTVAAAVVVAAVGVGYAGTPHDPERDRLTEVRENPDVAVAATPQPDPDVVVRERERSYVLRDADPAAEPVGLVFYPGGRVDPRAYLWTLAPLVEQTDVRVFVVRMPGNLAVLDPGAAAGVRARNPEVGRWYVGGHSLGGAMACQHAGNHPDEVGGVVLLAAYCRADLSTTGLAALVLTGSRDGVLDRERLRASRSNLPDDARLVELDGVNHSQFGAYGGQPGDRPATVDDERARRLATDALVAYFENASTGG